MTAAGGIGRDRDEGRRRARCGRSATTTASRSETVWEFGPVLVEACGIAAGQRVLDVAAGTGNVAHPRRRGRRARSSRPTSRRENFDAGRREARAPRGRARVGRGRRRGAAVRRRRVRRRHLLGRRDLRPRPPGGGRRAGARLPARRHDRDDQLHARGPGRRVLRLVRAATRRRRRPERRRRCCGGARSTCASCSATGVASLELTREEYVERARRRPRAYCELLQGRPSGRVVAPLREPRRRARARRRARPRASSSSPRARTEAPAGGPAEYRYEYLLVVARKRAG